MNGFWADQKKMSDYLPKKEGLQNDKTSMMCQAAIILYDESDGDDDDDCDVAHETSQDICAALEKLSKTRWLPRLRHTLCLSSTAPCLHANDDHDENRLVSSTQKPYSIIKSGILCPNIFHLKRLMFFFQ